MNEFEDKHILDELNKDKNFISHLKNYEFIKKIGQGGMGAVYKARQLHPQRIVAIKISKATSDRSARRFEREMQIASQLEHPGIAKIYDAGIYNNQKYLVMDYIDGKPLNEYFTTVSLQKKIQILIEVCSALDYAHRRSIIHRDLKPANIMITNNGKPVVIDFGLARNTHTRDFDLTKTGEIIGTPNYMAPEQITGKSAHIDQCVDIYALGAILYEIICGHRMVTGSSPLEAFFKIQRGNFVSPKKINPQVDKSLVNIWYKATAKKKQRYQQVEDLQNDLRKFLAGDTVKFPIRKRLYLLAIVLILLSSFAYRKSRSRPDIKLSTQAKARQLKMEKKRQRILHDIENKNFPLKIDIEGLNEQQNLDLVKALYNERLYQRALNLLKKTTRKTNFTETYTYYKALIFYQQGKYSEARKLFNLLVEKSEPSAEKYHYYLGKITFQLKDFLESFQHFKKAEPRFDNDLFLLEKIAHISEKNGDMETAKQYLKRCLSLAPSIGDYSVRLGQIALKSKDYDRAFFYLKKALATQNFYTALKLLHEIPYREPRLRRWCYQSIMNKFLTEKRIKPPDLFAKKWLEIENRYRQDYILQQQAKKQSAASIQSFLRELNNEEIQKTVHKALISLRYSKSFDAEINEFLKTKTLSQSSLDFFKAAAKQIKHIRAQEQQGAIYYQLANMHRNANWNSQKFIKINAEDYLKILRKETKVFLKYLLVKGYFHMFGFQAIIEIVRNPKEQVVTRTLCAVVLRKNYLAENSDTFYLSWRDKNLSKEEREFLQISISQALFVPHLVHREDTFDRPLRKDNQVEEEELQILQHFIDFSHSRRAAVAAAISFNALLPEKRSCPAHIDKLIFEALQQNDDLELSRYTHFMFWLNPNAKKAAYFSQYKKALRHPSFMVREIALSQVEIFHQRVQELMEELPQCITQSKSPMLRFRAIFAWTLLERQGKTIFEDPLYKRFVKKLTPMQHSALIIMMFYKFFAKTRRIENFSQAQIFAQILRFLSILRKELPLLPQTSQCMISYVMSLIQLHPPLQELKKLQDPALLSYFLYQLHEQVDLGNRTAYLNYVKAFTTKEKHDIAKQFLSHPNEAVQMYAVSSYVAFSTEKQQTEMFQLAKSSQQLSLKKGVALGHYFALRNAWIKNKKMPSIRFEDLFSGKSIELTLVEQFSRLIKFAHYIENEAPKKLKKYRIWAKRSMDLCPKQSTYIYNYHLFFPEENITSPVEDNNAIHINVIKFLDMVHQRTGVFPENNLNKYISTLHEIPPALLIHFAEKCRVAHRYDDALKLYEKYFLARVNDYSPFGLELITEHSDIMYCYLKKNNKSMAKIFLQYFYQLYRRQKHSRNTNSDKFFKKVCGEKPYIKSSW
ncbi:serine/threonine-protein kinase [Candidatus Uabimicrobium amorphum]|uniref:Serine/threonine protein kinase n=1 Tax=Uabimicrobium amorphum TaxID=2596890 RepID=A0A5S9IMC5_UABAM|nr:serine/threonine-protein kinase [Candidatus Uabimicrobium amorphum]BBM84354.1 serine/threonine protein kinase [Candidatus Uabimicrobium amorphum]